MINKTFKILPPSTGIDANWHVTDKGDTMTAHCFGIGHDIESGKALAERIALCLNACKGISDAELRRKLKFPCRECENMKAEKLEGGKFGGYVCSKTKNHAFVGLVNERPAWCPLDVA